MTNPDEAPAKPDAPDTAEPDEAAAGAAAPEVPDLPETAGEPPEGQFPSRRDLRPTRWPVPRVSGLEALAARDAKPDDGAKPA